MSNYGHKARPDMPVTEWRLPNLTGDPIRTVQREEYEFRHFGDESPEIHMTLEKAQAEAEAMVEKAREEAESLRAEAEAIKAEAERIRQSAHEEGYQKGFAQGEPKGEEAARQKFEKSAAPVFESFREIEDLYHSLWAANEPGLVRLAIMIAEKIVLHELNMAPEVITGAFKAALNQLHEQHHAVFRMNPEDLSYLESVRNEVKEEMNALVKITFEPDPNLRRGDLVMETDAGRVDATLKRRLEAVMSAVNESFDQAFGLDW